jgi:hypothetical protein
MRRRSAGAPLGAGSVGHVPVHDPASVERKHQEVEQAEGRGRRGEEVDAGERTGVVGKKRPPGATGTCRGEASAGHRALGDVDAEFQQLAVDAGAPHPRCSIAIRRIRSRSSLDVDGRPEPCWRNLQRQKRRKPRRCQRTTVSGRTITSKCAKCAQTRESHAQKTLSALLSRSRWARHGVEPRVAGGGKGSPEPDPSACGPANTGTRGR